MFASELFFSLILPYCPTDNSGSSLILFEESFRECVTFAVSISSITMIESAYAVENARSISSRLSTGNTYTGFSYFVAIALISDVLPLPGGPYNKRWSFDFVNYLCVRLQKHRPKAYMIVFRNQNNHAEIKVTSCVVFYGKFVCVPELLKNGKATFKRFTTRNDIFNYILDNLPYFDTSYTFQNIYHYIPKNRSFSIYTLIGTIFNIGKRVIYPPKEELID